MPQSIILLAFPGILSHTSTKLAVPCNTGAAAVTSDNDLAYCVYIFEYLQQNLE